MIIIFMIIINNSNDNNGHKINNKNSNCINKKE